MRSERKKLDEEERLSGIKNGKTGGFSTKGEMGGKLTVPRKGKLGILSFSSMEVNDGKDGSSIAYEQKGSCMHLPSIPLIGLSCNSGL